MGKKKIFLALSRVLVRNSRSPPQTQQLGETSSIEVNITAIYMKFNCQDILAYLSRTKREDDVLVYQALLKSLRASNASENAILNYPQGRASSTVDSFLIAMIFAFDWLTDKSISFAFVLRK